MNLIFCSVLFAAASLTGAHILGAGLFGDPLGLKNGGIGGLLPHEGLFAHQKQEPPLDFLPGPFGHHHLPLPFPVLPFGKKGFLPFGHHAGDESTAETAAAATKTVVATETHATESVAADKVGGAAAASAAAAASTAAV